MHSNTALLTQAIILPPVLCLSCIIMVKAPHSSIIIIGLILLVMHKFTLRLIMHHTPSISCLVLFYTILISQEFSIYSLMHACMYRPSVFVGAVYNHARHN